MQKRAQIEKNTIAPLKEFYLFDTPFFEAGKATKVTALSKSHEIPTIPFPSMTAAM